MNDINANYKSLWNTTKAVLRQKLIANRTILRKKENQYSRH